MYIYIYVFDKHVHVCDNKCVWGNNTTTSSNGSSITTTQALSSESSIPESIHYYIWSLNNNQNNTSNQNPWNISTHSLNYTIVEDIMALVNVDNPEIKFDDKAFEGNIFSISFKLKINADITKKFNILSNL